MGPVTVGYVLPMIAPDGYTGPIDFLLAVNTRGEIMGARVTRHKETPGLGDKIELTKSDWILQFNQRSLSQPLIEQWKVKKDGGEFDQLTGATITPRSIVNAIQQGLTWFAENQEKLQLQMHQNLTQDAFNSDASNADGLATTTQDNPNPAPISEERL